MLSSMLKHLVPKFCPDLSVRLKDIAEKQVPAKLKPIVVGGRFDLSQIGAGGWGHGSLRLTAPQCPRRVFLCVSYVACSS